MNKRPLLSVIIPAYNEAHCLEGTLTRARTQLEAMRIGWEIVVVNDGSTDATGRLAAEWAARDTRVRALDIPHAGKGAAVRHGMLAAFGEWRFMADADLSMPIEDLDSLCNLRNGGPEVPIVVGSREAAGAVRVNEPWWRHAIGRVFSTTVRVVLLPGIEDTQCGFKLFSRAAAETLFSLQQLNGFGFDVEILALARHCGFAVREVPITWHYSPRSTVTVNTGARAFADVLRVRWNLFRGAYGAVTRVGQSVVVSDTREATGR